MVKANRNCWALLLAALVFLAALVPATTWAQAAPQDPDQALRSAERGTVRVIALYLDEYGDVADVSIGSGFVVSPGRVVSNAHVVSKDDEVASMVFVVPDRGSGSAGVRGRIAGGVRAYDLALIDAPDLMAPPLILSTAVPSRNATVHALGYPGVTDAIRRLSVKEIVAPTAPYVTPGSIALLSDTAPGGMPFQTIFHTAAVNPGNSGGPLIDGCGRVIGINTWMASATVSGDDLNVPVGQSIASRTSNVLAFLARYGVQPLTDSAPCVIAPPVDPLMEARLAAAEKALADEQAARAARETAADAAKAQKTQIANSVLSGALVGALVSGVAFGFAYQRKMAAGYRISALVACLLFVVVAVGAYTFTSSNPPEPASPQPQAPAPVEPPGSPSPGIGATPEAPQAVQGSPVSTPLGQPSFDCSLARSYAEKTICTDQRLAFRDARLAALYSRALQTGEAASVRAEALQRWREREACTDPECLMAWYDRREVELAAPANSR
jgi:hypothetical protein